uniref:ATP-dependent transporter ycf16 n=1 Tax=Eutreptiella gymnastica TaxID=73025 RepID=A0A7S4FWP9_9EUGL
MRVKAQTVMTKFDKLWEAQQQKKDPKLWIALFGMVKYDIMIVMLYGALYSVTVFTVPFLFPRVLDVISGKRPQWEGYMYAGIIYGMNIVGGIIQSHSQARMQGVALQVRGALSCVIYNKALKLGTDAWKQTTTGQVFNMVGQRVEQLFRSMPILQAASYVPLLVIIAFAYLFYVLGWAAAGGLVVLCIAVPFNYHITKSFRVFLFGKYGFADKRMTIMNQVLQAIRVIKFYAWENSFIEGIQDQRRQEVKISRKLSLQVAKLMVSQNFAPSLFQLAIFVVYALVNDISNVGIIFTSIALVNMIRQSFAILPFIFSNLQTSSATLTDIKKYLMLPEIDPNTEAGEGGRGEVRLRRLSLRWGKEADPVFTDVELSVQPGELVMIVGKVGSGKTSLLNAILQEGEVQGQLHVGGTVAYVPQQAWIMNAKLQDNVLFGKPYSAAYDQTIRVCDLRADLKNLPDGDQTEIGEKGINISGGQKQRISLARAVYQDADIYLLDDPLSAVDVHVGRRIFERCINGVLKKKTRILVTNQLQYLSHADRIYLLQDTAVLPVTLDSPEMQEMLEDHRGNSAVTKQAAQTAGAVDPGAATQDEEEQKAGADTDSLLSRQQSKNMSDSFSAPKNLSNSFAGLSQRLSSRVSLAPDTVDRLDRVEEDVARLSMDMPLPAELRRSSIASHVSHASATSCASAKQPPAAAAKPAGKLTEDEDRVEGGITWGTYKKYLGPFGGVCWFITNVLITTLQHVFEKGSQLWLGLWAEGRIFPGMPAYFFLSVYGGMIVLSAICVALREVQFALGSARPMWVLHESALQSVFAAPMSYFDTTPSGRIINRFTGDIQDLDFLLPLFFNQHVNMSFILVASVVTVLIAAPWFVVVVAVVYGLYLLFARYYAKSSLELRRLFAITKSPVLSHFQESLQGLGSIRAYAQQDRFYAEFRTRLDANSACYFTERIGFEWMRFRCNQLSAVMIGGASLCLIALRDYIDPSLAGLALSQAVLFVVVSSQATEFYIQATVAMACAERLSSFDSIESEEAGAMYQAPPDDWPSAGAIQLSDLKARYRTNTPLVLKGINIEIKPGEKIGFVGRTGSGKSSMLLALYRMLMIEGTINIDGIDISKVSRRELRKRLCVIPQEPVLFKGTLRYNLDPTSTYSDDNLWRALELSNLAEYVKVQEVEGGDNLNMHVEEGGSSLSVGQAQLICLARAVLRKSKLLFMDEATASVDVTTDKLIQNVIRENFQDCTVITIAHRLHTIMDCDRVLVLDHGQVAEYDTPQKLCADPDSVFGGMLKQGTKLE